MLEAWVARLAQPVLSSSDHIHGHLVAANVQAYLRALHLQLALTPNPPSCRADLLLAVIGQLKTAKHAVLAG